ncbi:hypothetical protein EK21DRAFT_91982 [Setomelanomma holmii]|uniref:Uncharacterized protein n=1 Tax=Setomelanomma holmii TaxID=210430 RepID=A0A9P4H3P4_9PLEO|nr:hypothetical protein EK21DRAFT_91982 [Setomelanomma holmii]
MRGSFRVLVTLSLASDCWTMARKVTNAPARDRASDSQSSAPAPNKHVLACLWKDNGSWHNEDNLDFLLFSMFDSLMWMDVEGEDASAPNFDARIPTDFAQLTVEIIEIPSPTRDAEDLPDVQVPAVENTAHSNTDNGAKRFLARVRIEDRVMTHSRASSTEPEALRDLYEAVNEIVQEYGSGRRRYIQEEEARQNGQRDRSYMTRAR